MQGDPYSPNFISKDIAVINHYKTQCLERFINHKVLNQNFRHIYGDDILELYFTFNLVTEEKLNAFKEICNKYSITVDDNLYEKYYNELI